MSHTTFKMMGKELEIMFYGDIGDEFDGITAKQFADELKPHANASKILIRMNSIGGDAFDGAAIYNTLKRHKAKVEIEVDGASLSAASLVAMAGDDIRMAENAMMMIHEPWAAQLGTASDMRAQADRLDKMGGVYAETYSKRSKQELKHVMSMMQKETWMTAEEAVEFGFADSIVGSKRIAARAVPEGLFKKTPDSMMVKPEASVIDYRAKLEAALGQ